MSRLLLSTFLIVYLIHILIQQAKAAIHISEIYPVPEAGKYEWVEIVNTSSTSVNMQGYVLRDVASHNLFLPHIILDGGQFIIATASGVLNNSGDTVELVLNGGILESVTYPSGISSMQSYNLCGDQWMIIDSITPGFDSGSCLEDEPTPEPTDTYNPTSTIQSVPTSRPTSKLSQTPPRAKPSPNMFIATESSKKEIQSFTEKHTPIASTNVTNQLSPTTVLLKNVKETSTLPAENRTFSKLPIYIIGGIIGAYCIALGGIIGYRIMKKWRESSYNEVYDT